jgi:sec-independent protein translocase protein TatA
MFGLGFPELILIFVVALLIFGPKKLPDLGKSIGRAMAEFKKAQQDLQDSIQSEMKDVEKSVEKSIDLEEIRRLEQLDLTGKKEGEEKKPEQAPGQEAGPDRNKEKETGSNG